LWREYGLSPGRKFMRAKPFSRSLIVRLVAVAVVSILALPAAARAQQTFQTPDEALNALVDAARRGDRRALLKVLGPSGPTVISSGDDVADATTRQGFVAAYDAGHRVVMQGDNKARVVVGAQDLSFPVPLVRSNGRWWFDTPAARLDIALRRIGRNERQAVETARAYVEAQNRYAGRNPSGAGAGTYAQRIVSRPGRRDGLYWPARSGEEPSPLDALAASAMRQGYRDTGRRGPYHGYLYRILTRQGASASGGAMDYVVGGRMTGGFALVAYPVDFGNSGVMTFMVGREGTVYQRDFGPRTRELAERISFYDPDANWRKVERPERPRP
jgi:Protein of unknown function (DUF2950)